MDRKMQKEGMNMTIDSLIEPFAFEQLPSRTLISQSKEYIHYYCHTIYINCKANFSLCKRQ